MRQIRSPKVLLMSNYHPILLLKLNFLSFYLFIHLPVVCFGTKISVTIGTRIMPSRNPFFDLGAALAVGSSSAASGGAWFAGTASRVSFIGRHIRWIFFHTFFFLIEIEQKYFDK